MNEYVWNYVSRMVINKEHDKIYDIYRDAIRDSLNKSTLRQVQNLGSKIGCVRMRNVTCSCNLS